MEQDLKRESDFRFQTIVRKLDSKEFRIRSLPKSLSLTVPWITAKRGQPTVCAAMIGPVGGLILSPMEGEVIQIKNVVEKTLYDHPPTFNDAGSERLKLARLAAGIWLVKFSFESSQKFTLTLFAEMREIGIFPETEKYLVIFPTGGIIEVWPANEWRMHQCKLMKEVSNILAAARDEIDGL